MPETNSIAYQPFVKVERLSAKIYQECISKGYFKVKEDKSILNPNPRPFVTDAGVMAKLKETVFQKYPNRNVKIVVVPQKLIKNQFQNNSGSNIPTAPLNKPLPKLIFPPREIVRYGVEDLKRDELKRKEETKKKFFNQKNLRTMLDKYHEKETKKEVLYRQKILTKFVLKHKEVVNPYTNFLICARKYVKGRKDGKRILKELAGIKNSKIRNYVQMFFKDLLHAIEEVPVDKSKKLSRGQHGESKFDKKVSKQIVLDPFVNADLITDDQQLIECICGKPNCLGMHPEKFF